MDFNILIKEKISEINFEEIAIKAATDSIQKSVEKAIKEQFSSYSDFTKQLEKHLASELKIDFATIKLPEYREFLIGKISESLSKFTTEDQAKAIREYIAEKVVGEGRETIPFNTFWDELVEMIEECIDEESGMHYELISECDSLGFQKIKLVFDSERNYSYSKGEKRECLYIGLHKDHIYHVRKSESVFDNFPQIETWLKALKYQRTIITNIEDNQHSFERYD